MSKEDFVHLHTHSDMSQLDGCATISNYVKEVARRKAPAIALTEHGTMRGYFKQFQECEKHDIKPIYGIEFYVSNDMYRKGLTTDEKVDIVEGLKKSERKQAIKNYEEQVGIRDRWHLTVWAKNNQGLKNLFRLSTLAYTEGFYYKPRIDLKTLMKHGDGLIVATGCLSSVIYDRAIAGKKIKAHEVAESLRARFGEDLWIEVQPHELGIQVDANKFALELKERWGKHAKLLATQDAHYVNRHDACHHDVMLCIGTRDFMDNPHRFHFDGDEFYLKTRKEMWKSFRKHHSYMSKKQVKEALNSTVELSEMVDTSLDIDYHAALLPKVGIPSGFDDEWDYFKNLCLDGWREKKIEEKIVYMATKRGHTALKTKEEYKDRLIYEMSVLRDNDFISYFLIVHDLYDWCRKQKIYCGPGRGSVAGSLVSYLLGFTALDPIEHGLIFERFINPGRVDEPDIDADFEDSRRQEIIDYLHRKYGSNNVARIATVGTLKGKQCLKDVSRVLRVPYLDAQDVVGSVIESEKGSELTLERSFKESEICKTFDKKYPEVYEHAIVLEGMAKSVGIHAAGVVIAPDELTNYLPVETRVYDGERVNVTALDKKGVQAMGLVKLDILGLKTLTVLREALGAVEEHYGKHIDLRQLELDDKDVLQLFTDNDLSGVFQFDTPHAFKMCEKVTFESFSDIAVLNALMRPGTSRSGLAEQFIDRKNNPELRKTDIFHPKVTEATKDSLGVICYQEHVIQIFVDIAGYTLSEADILRKAIGASEGDETIAKERDKFLEGAKSSGLSEKIIKKVFNAIVKFGSYAFNKSHATAYGLISYWCQWMKHYYPLQFYWALMKREDQAIKIQAVARDARKRDIRLLPPDVSISGEFFTIDLEKNAIRGSLTDIKGIGEKAAYTVIKNKPYKNFMDFLIRIDKRKCNKGSVVALARAGALDDLLPNVKWFVENIEDFWKKLLKSGVKSKSIRKSLIRSAEKDDYTEEEKQIIALKVNPIAFGKHPFEVYEKFLKKHIKVPVALMDEEFFEKNDKKSVYVAGLKAKAKMSKVGDYNSKEPSEEEKKKMSWGAQYATVYIEDVCGIQNRMKFDHSIFEEYYPVIDADEGTPVIAHVTVDYKYRSLRVNFAVDLEMLRGKIKNASPLSYWDKIVMGKHPALDYPWKDEEEAEQWIKNGHFSSKRDCRFCGVITRVQRKNDRTGREMAFFGVLGVDKYVDVVCFGSSWPDVKKVINSKEFIVISLDKKVDKIRGTSYIFDGRAIKLLRKSSF